MLKILLNNTDLKTKTLYNTKSLEVMVSMTKIMLPENSEILAEYKGLLK